MSLPPAHKMPFPEPGVGPSIPIADQSQPDDATEASPVSGGGSPQCHSGIANTPAFEPAQVPDRTGALFAQLAGDAVAGLPPMTEAELEAVALAASAAVLEDPTRGGARVLVRLANAHGTLPEEAKAVLLYALADGEPPPRSLLVRKRAALALLTAWPTLTTDELLYVFHTMWMLEDCVRGVVRHSSADAIVWQAIAQDVLKRINPVVVARYAPARREPSVRAILRRREEPLVDRYLCVDATPDEFRMLFARLVRTAPAVALRVLEDAACSDRVATLTLANVEPLLHADDPLVRFRSIVFARRFRPAPAADLLFAVRKLSKGAAQAAW